MNSRSLSSSHACRHLLCAMGLALMVSLPSWAAPPANKFPTEPITLNFMNADIESASKALAVLFKRNLVVDPRVKGTINLTTDEPLLPAEAWSQFLAVLRMQGYAVVETNRLYKIVPEADAKVHGGGLSEATGDKAGAGNGQIVTKIFRLQYEQANNLVPVLRPLISANNTLNVNPATNSLVITDYADNLQRIARIIANLDVVNASDVEVIQLKHAIAADLAPLVTRLIDSTAQVGSGAAAGTPQTDGSYRTVLMAEPRSNALIVRAANTARLALVRTLVAKLDQPGSQGPSGNIHVVYLRNAEATKLAITLRAAIGAQNGLANLSGALNPSAGIASTPVSTMAVASSSSVGATPNAVTTGGQIQADPATNSLIISAPEPQYRQIRAVIDQLDQRRAQVLVESLIAEVNAEKAIQIGFQWQTSLGGNGVVGTNFGSVGNIAGLSQRGTAAATGIGTGLNVGNVRNVNGTNVLTSLANFLETNADANILSTPTIMTLDNEEAKIVVGQNVPFTTGSYANLNNMNTGGAVSPFQTFDRKDVGLTLRVKPQISETGTVKLTVYQEVSNVVQSADAKTVADQVLSNVINKRSIESNVLVEDGGVVVLGGLLSDDFTNGKSQVPALGDIPLFGMLFRNESRGRKKTNLMVFLRPVILRDGEMTDALSTSRYQQMIGVQRAAQPSYNLLLDTGGTAVLPVLPATKNTPPSGTVPPEPSVDKSTK